MAALATLQWKAENGKQKAEICADGRVCAYCSREGAARSGGAEASPFATAQAAIWAREENPSFVRVRVVCASTVLIPTTRAAAMARLDFPCAIRIATSRSRAVSPPKSSCEGWCGVADGACWIAAPLRAASSENA